MWWGKSIHVNHAQSSGDGENESRLVVGEEAGKVIHVNHAQSSGDEVNDSGLVVGEEAGKSIHTSTTRIVAAMEKTIHDLWWGKKRGRV